MPYQRIQYLTRATSCETWFESFSGGKMQKQSFGCYFKNLFLRWLTYPFAWIPKVRRMHAMAKEKTYLIVSRRSKTMLVKLLDAFEREARIVLWYWDSAMSGYPILPQKAKYKRVLVASFDRVDCEKYGFFYNGQCFYEFEHLPCVKESCICRDALFIGNAKGRDAEILAAERALRAAGLQALIRIHRSDLSGVAKEDRSCYTTQYISYEKICRLVQESRAVLEVVVPHSAGLTFRAMEAAFFGKKLITTNRHIRKYDIYHPNNVFVLGEDDLAHLGEWMDIPYAALPQEVLRKYQINEWCERLISKAHER